MKLQHLLIHLTGLCLGIFTYTYITDQPIMEAVRNSYWYSLGGIFVWFKMKGDSK